MHWVSRSQTTGLAMLSSRWMRSCCFVLFFTNCCNILSFLWWLIRQTEQKLHSSAGHCYLTVRGHRGVRKDKTKDIFRTSLKLDKSTFLRNFNNLTRIKVKQIKIQFPFFGHIAIIKICHCKICNDYTSCNMSMQCAFSPPKKLITHIIVIYCI